MDIKQVLAKGETEEVEFKERLNEATYKTISAFANVNGGIILIGVNRKGNVVSVDASDKAIRGLANRIVDMLKVQPSINAIQFQGKTIIAIKVEPSKIPVSFKGKYFKRVGNTTREISPEELGKLFIRKWGISWDGIIGEFLLEEIDKGALQRFVKISRERLPYISEKEDIKTILAKMGLIKNGKLTSGVILLFGKNPQKHFFMARVRVGRFKDPITIIDDKEINGNLFNQLEETIKIIQQYIQVRYEIEGRIRRKEVWDYPIEALREALINALIHRDYFHTGADIQIKVFDDKLMIWNIGGLPEGIKLEDLRKEYHGSVLRNPLLAQVFYYSNFIEKWGTGTARIIKACLKQGLPEPTFEETSGGFQVTFCRDIFTEENLRKMGLNERQIKAVLYVKQRRKITNKEYQEINNISRQMATIDLSILTKKGIFTRTGKTGKGIAYQLTKLTNKRLIIDQIDQKDIAKTTLRYYCTTPGNKEIKLLLEEIKKNYNIEYEIIEGPYDIKKDKQVYERYFKPRAKILKKRTGMPITKLRSRKAGNYFVSIPGTIAVFRNDLIEYWVYMDKEMINFLKKVLLKGQSFIKELLGT